LFHAFTCPIMHAKTLSFDDHRRMNKRSKKIYKHPQNHAARIQLNQPDTPNASMVKHNKHAISTKQGIVQNPVSRAAFSYKK